MSNILGVRFPGSKAQRSARLQDALPHLRKRIESLLESVFVDFSIFNQDIGSALDKLIDLAVIVEKTHDEVVDGEQGSRSDDSAGDAVVVADDGVLYGVG